MDEELPNPDTVRKARILFEETLRLRNYQKQDDTASGNGTRSNEKLRRKALRYLTIDTSFANGAKKWDSSSVSSGISSGELSSPCECNDHDDSKEVYSSEENIYGYDMCESYYVSQVGYLNFGMFKRQSFNEHFGVLGCLGKDSRVWFIDNIFWWTCS